MTEIRLVCLTKMVVGVLAYQWAVEVVSPFVVGLVAGGKGGVVVMMMVGLPTWAESVYAILRIINGTCCCPRGPWLHQFTGA